MSKKITVGFIVFTGLVFGLYGSAHAQVPANLIGNPSVETAGTGGDPANWSRGGWGTNTRTFTYPAIGYVGAKAVKVEITSYTNGDAKWFFQDAPVTTGQTYTFTDNYISNIPSFLSVRFKMVNGTFTYLDLPQIPSSAGVWKNEQRTFTIPTNVTSVTVFHVIKQVGYITTDNFSLTSDSVPPPPPEPIPGINLIQNPTFETLGANGDPVGWLRGGYGQNTRSYQVVECKNRIESVAGLYYHTDADLLLTGDEPGAVYRPACPPNARLTLRVSTGDYLDGDAKWYFSDVAIGTNKNFRIGFQYQAYTYAAQVTARYTFPDGSYSYSLISDMPQRRPYGMGGIAWVYAEHDFTAPVGATSLTVFFSVRGNGVCGVYCLGPSFGTLSIANPILRLREASELPAVGADLTPPTAVITIPAGSTVSGTTTVLINANDNVSVGAVRLYIDGIPGPIDTTFPYSIDWDTTSQPDTETRTLSVRSVDKWGSNVGGHDSTNIGVTVKNDNTSPTLFITSPITGATVSGTTTVSVTATDNLDVAVVSLFVDGIDIGAYDFVAPYSFLLDTSALSNATHILMAHAWDSSNNSGTSSPITISVANSTLPPPPPPPDTTPPTASITSPIAGATVSGTTTVSISAVDNLKMQNVSFLVDGNIVFTRGLIIGSSGAGENSPILQVSESWNTNSLTNGPHILTAIARDFSGNVGTSTSVTVNINNIAPPPPPPTLTNLIINPSLETLGGNGDPTNWFRGGWGNNTRALSLIDKHQIPPGSEWCGDFIHANFDGNKVGVVTISNYVDGDVKWYFADVPIGVNKTFTLNHSYRQGNYITQLIARYLLNNGTYQYVKIADLGWTGGGGCGGTEFSHNVTHTFTAPNNAISMTLYQKLISNGFLEVDKFILTTN